MRLVPHEAHAKPQVKVTTAPRVSPLHLMHPLLCNAPIALTMHPLHAWHCDTSLACYACIACDAHFSL